MRNTIWQCWTGLAACALVAALLQVATAADASRTKITLVLTSDVYKMGDENGRGGMARIASVRRYARYMFRSTLDKTRGTS